MNAHVTPLPIAPVEKKLRTITLTNRAPIQIDENEWPVIAQGSYGIAEPEAPVSFSIEFRVRCGPYDRVIVHGKYEYYDDLHEAGQSVRVGRVLHRDENYNLWTQMLEVGEEMRGRIEHERHRKYLTFALDACFANLKPQPF